MDATTDPAAKPIARWRWWVHLALFAACPLVAVVRPAVAEGSAAQPLLPSTVSGLLEASFVNMAAFGIVVALAWLFSRATSGDLLLAWRGGIRPIFLGAAYSVLLRVVLFVLVMTVMVGWIMARGPAEAQAAAEKLRPETSNLIASSALTGNPVYLALCLTLISFVVAGLREEVWRVGMMAGILKILEPRLTGRPAEVVAVFVSSALFGLAHLTQGWGGVLLTGVLGLGFGLMMVFHRSVWEAVFAHGFFDATTFVAIFLIAKYLPGTIPGL